MIYTLENQYLSVRVASHGGELQSIYSKEFEREYIWQAAAETWNNHSLLLFPTAGRIARNRIFVKGKEYPMAMHGFAKDMEFNLVDKKDELLILEITGSEETLRQFPYKFRFQVEFSLEGKSMAERFRIINEGNESMSFGFGAHPGFYCPIVLGESADDYCLEFDHPQTIRKIHLEPNTRLCTYERSTMINKSIEIPLSEHFFDDGPILSEGYDAKFVRLISRKSGHFIEMSLEKFPYITFWGCPHKMHLICIEPWCGLSDFIDTDHVWEKKIANNTLQAGEVFKRELVFIAGKL
jgi:galactose mutarotase-like enzyme